MSSRRRTGASSISSRAAAWTACASTTPTASPIPAPTSRSCRKPRDVALGDACAPRRECHADLARDREDPGIARAAAGDVAHPRRHRLSLHECGERALRGSRRRVPHDARVRRRHRRAAQLRRGRASRKGAHRDPRARKRPQPHHDVARAHRQARPAHLRLHRQRDPPRADRAGGGLSGLSQLRRHAGRERRRRASRRLGRGHRQARQPAGRGQHLRRDRRDTARRLRAARCESGRAPRRIRPPLPAVHGPRDGQGLRGYGALPVQSPGVAERGGRRSAGVRLHGGGVPPGQCAACARLAPRDARHIDARQPSAARTCVCAWTSSRRCRGRGGSRCAAGGRSIDAIAPRRRRGRAECERRVPPLPDAARRLAQCRHIRPRGLPRAHPGVHAKGRTRGQAAHELGERGRRLRACARAPSSTGCWAAPRPMPSSPTSCHCSNASRAPVA